MGLKPDIIPVEKDSLYRIEVKFETGFNCTEAKFTVNDAFELEKDADRRIVLSKKDTNYYDAKFNVRDKK